jgi:hypothetical protein
LATYKLDYKRKRWHTIKFGDFSVESNSFIFVLRNFKMKAIQLGEIIFYAEKHTDGLEQDDGLTRLEVTGSVEAEFTALNGGGTG